MIVKLSRTAIMVLSVVSMLCTGCTAPSYEALDDSSVRAEEDSSAVIEEDSSALLSPTLIDGLRGQAWHVAPEVYYYKYKEPSVMEDTGVFYGVNVGFTSRYWVPASPEEAPWESKWMGRAEGRFAYGQVDYDGATWGGTPLTINNIEQYVLEGRLLLGPDFPSETSMLTVFTGIAYRYFHDDTSFYVGGYERESNYLYLPLGLEMLAQLNEGWSWGASVEFDVFLWGLQKSRLSDAGGADVDNRQNNGYGARASAKLQKQGDKVDLIIEPFIRYWDIGQSEIEMGVLEPKNYTVEAGIQLVLVF